MFNRLEDIDKDKIRKVIAIGWFWFFGTIAMVIAFAAIILVAIPIIMLVFALVIAALLVIPATFIYPSNSFTYKNGVHSWSWNWNWWRGFKFKRETLTQRQIAGDDITKPPTGRKGVSFKEESDGDSKISN